MFNQKFINSIFLNSSHIHVKVAMTTKAQILTTVKNIPLSTVTKYRKPVYMQHCNNFKLSTPTGGKRDP